MGCENSRHVGRRGVWDRQVHCCTAGFVCQSQTRGAIVGCSKLQMKLGIVSCRYHVALFLFKWRWVRWMEWGGEGRGAKWHVCVKLPVICQAHTEPDDLLCRTYRKPALRFMNSRMRSIRASSSSLSWPSMTSSSLSYSLSSNSSSSEALALRYM